MAAGTAPLLGVSARRPSTASSSGGNAFRSGGSSTGGPAGLRAWRRSSTRGRLSGRHAGMLAVTSALCATALLLLGAGERAMRRGGTSQDALQQRGAAASSDELIWPVWW